MGPKHPQNYDVSCAPSPLVLQGISKVCASKLITSQRMQITKLTQQNISSVSAHDCFYLPPGGGPCPSILQSQEPGLPRGPHHSRGQEKAKPLSFLEYRPSYVLFPLPAMPFPAHLCLANSYSVDLQVSAKTSPSPGSPSCMSS